MSHGRPVQKRNIDLGADDDDDLAIPVDRSFYFSTDGLRSKEEVGHLRHKKRRLEPSELNDSLAEWIPVPDENFDEDRARNPPEGDVDATAASILGKRKEYVSTTNPMSLFRPMSTFFVDELLRHEGLGDDLANPQCAHCKVAFEPGDVTSPRIFKCSDCGEFLQCESCCLLHHKRTSLHSIQEYNGSFWVDYTLAKLGLVYQLGHGGFPCPFPDDFVRNMTVIDAPIIHQVRIQYCKCSKSDSADNLEQLLRNKWYPATCSTFRSLEGYRMYNVVGNLNVRDYITALERMTDTTASSGMTWLPNRYKQFQRMARQWAFVKRVRRVGRGHHPGGVGATKLSETAVRCWPCPHDKRNIPEDWRDVDPKFRFLYMLILAVDANFRLKNRMRKNEIDDPPLGPGWGYWVEPKEYRKHVKKYVNETDVSTCIAFAALLQKDTRLTTGLRVSGVGGCVCARHECMRPNGLGDLQKGERYVNMDFIVMSAVMGFALMLLTISYDIACQWKTNLAHRMPRLPTPMQLPLSEVKLQCALPVWHAGSHNEDCKNANSLSFKPGVGKTDGEGVERVWSKLNPASYSTRDAGSGQRADILEGKIDDHNFLKNLGQGDALQRKLVVAIAERDRQITAFKEVNKTLSSEVRKTWKGLIDAWLEDPSQPNPYILERKDCPTEAEVRLDVRKDEDALSVAGRAPLHGRSATAFLTAGIQIEDAQRRILAELAGTVLVAADRENTIEEWRHAVLNKIAKFRNLQKIYMPGAARTMATVEEGRDTETAPPKAEKIKLYMPSDIAAINFDYLASDCVPGLADMEAKLRVGQCDNSLVSVRAQLHTKRFLIGFRNENIVGQVQATKARTLIGQVGGKGGELREEAHPHLRDLKADDVQIDGDDGESDAASRKKLAMIGSGRGARAPRDAPGTSKRVMSWIWTAPGALDDEEERLHDSIRVEWARARARKVRWTEEVLLLREEMRRVLRYLAWQAGWWREQVGLRSDWTAEVEDGARAYACKQAAWHERLAGYFRTKWDISALAAAQQLVAGDGADLDDFFGQYNNLDDEHLQQLSLDPRATEPKKLKAEELNRKYLEKLLHSRTLDEECSSLEHAQALLSKPADFRAAEDSARAIATRVVDQIERTNELSSRMFLEIPFLGESTWGPSLANLSLACIANVGQSLPNLMIQTHVHDIIARGVQSHVCRSLVAVYQWTVNFGPSLADQLVSTYRNEGEQALVTQFPDLAPMVQHVVAFLRAHEKKQEQLALAMEKRRLEKQSEAKKAARAATNPSSRRRGRSTKQIVGQAHSTEQQGLSDTGPVPVSDLIPTAVSALASDTGPSNIPQAPAVLDAPNFSRFPGDLFGLLPPTKTMIVLEGLGASVRIKDDDTLYALAAKYLCKLWDENLILRPMVKVDDSLNCPVKNTSQKVTTTRERMEHVRDRCITRGAILQCIAEVFGDGIFAASAMKEFLYRPCKLFPGGLNRDPHFARSSERDEMRTLEALQSCLIGFLVEDPHLESSSDFFGELVHRRLLSLKLGQALTDEQYENPHLPASVLFSKLVAPSKAGTLKRSVKPPPDVQPTLQSLLPQMPEFGIAAISIREALSKRREHPTKGTMTRRNPDQMDPVRGDLQGFNLLHKVLPAALWTTPAGISSLLAFMGTGQGTMTRDFLLSRESMLFDSLQACVQVFSQMETRNVQDPTTAITYQNPSIYGQVNLWYSCHPSVLVGGNIYRLLTISEKFSPYFSEALRRSWLAFLGPLANRDPTTTPPLEAPRRKWEEVFHWIVDSGLMGFGSGLAPFQFANNVVLAGLATPPSPAAMAQWIYANKDYGAFAGLRVMGFKLEKSASPAAVRAAFICVYCWLDYWLSDNDKKLLRFDTIFVEQLLCKVTRWNHRLSTMAKINVDHTKFPIPPCSAFTAEIFRCIVEEGIAELDLGAMQDDDM
ncbi:hypothetical protein C8F04DRAFT_1265444 [Mycena alexandri]|uniref:CxC2-like cysteine cluster KDZ transposase-associated domain-containing protein n=1 Tax=Mycena alexandri TaxID=1745969 RepID=A0AAD6SLD5_9AGAR|nr:hypothetical protein C8F04DRAFT_1265444 [Mycena alexandri]